MPRCVRHGVGMHSARDSGGLPVPYQQMLKWLDEGRSDAEIAELLDIDVFAVRPMVRLAEAKLARLSGEPTSGDAVPARGVDRP